MIEQREKLVAAYANLSVSDKRKELGRELAEASVMIYKLLSDITGVESMPNMDEFNNLYDGTTSEDVYLSGLYEDLINFKELLSIYLDKVIADKYE